ncbi:xanthine dehydrogenase family protein subunit M [Pigmentiphaga soli]|uniref:Xanthine dehydrogenase family protein subunit M n=1 Tax=Pigmentiphaga soli TaxID=1007095 RepID=A0ABP8HTP8_9BURK
MKPAPFTYHRARSVDEALALLAGAGDARILAGGQSLVPMLNLRLAMPEHLIDISRIAELDHVEERGGRIAIGAATRQRTIEFSPLVAARLPLLAAAILHVGHRQTRNRGTLGGSLCHLDPSAELALMACVHDAQLVARSPRGERVLTMAAFALGTMTTALEPDEMLTEVRFSPWPAGHGFGFHEFARRHGDWAMASAAALVTLDGAGRIERAALALGGVADTPLRHATAEAMLIGQAPGDALLRRAAVLPQDVVVLDDDATPAWYRRQLAETMARRALADAVGRAAKAARQ